VNGPAAAAAVAIAAAGAACHDPGEHVYSGQLFDPQARCVAAAPSALDVLAGAATGDSCAAACLVASSQVFVSRGCPPYPPGFSVEAADATTGASDPCAAALEAFAAGTTCGADAATESGPAGAEGSAPVDASDAG
jgi:hypothetical protein